MEQTEKIINETGQDGEQFVKTFLKAENIRRLEQRGGKTFEGNQAMKLLSLECRQKMSRKRLVTYLKP